MILRCVARLKQPGCNSKIDSYMSHAPDPAIIPEKIIDAHHHLWDLQACHYPWLMEKGVKRFFGDPAPIQKNYLLKDFKSDFAELPVEKSVHIQVGTSEEDSVQESRWLQECADLQGYPHAIIAFADLTVPELDSTLDQQLAFSNLRGIRQIVGRDPKEDTQSGSNALLSNPAFKTGLQILAQRGLSFDLQLTPPLLCEAARLFLEVEALPVALCHAGSPQDFSRQGVAEWINGLKSWIRHENMICKLSGFGMFEPDWTITSIREKLLRAIDLFGPERIAFGSNFPVDKLTASYATTMGAYFEITADFSTSERDKMFYKNAARFYRI